MSEYSVYDDPNDMDLNHDGSADDVTVTQHGDTTVFSADTDGDGVTDTVAVDGADTGDGGRVDAVYYDTDGDGQADVADVDTDHDGNLDTRYSDTDGDGQVDQVDASDDATDTDPFADSGSTETPDLDPFTS